MTTELKRLRAENERQRWLLKQILGSLPLKRDWLDPTVEAEARAALA